jgi:hypothetical protein
MVVVPVFQEDHLLPGYRKDGEIVNGWWLIPLAVYG